MPPEPSKDPGCFGITPERKYYHRGNAFIKRCLRPSEFITNRWGQKHVPRLRKESLANEVASLRYVREHTDVPVPTLYCDFEDDDAYYVITEYVEGVGMNELYAEQRAVVEVELERHVATLHSLTSRRMGGPDGHVILPYRVRQHTKQDSWTFRGGPPDDGCGDEFVFCHNDLSQHNVVVDPETLKITGIVDWEYAGFYPAWFEMAIYKRIGPSVALDGEEDDSLAVLDFVRSRSEA